MASRNSGPEEDEPDHTQDQDRQPSGYGQERKHRGAGFSLAGLGRGLDDLAMSTRCHGEPHFKMRVISACNASYCLDTTCRKQRLIGNDVPDFRAIGQGLPAQKVAAERTEQIA